jgi:hypothetical protein
VTIAANKRFRPTVGSPPGESCVNESEKKIPVLASLGFGRRLNTGVGRHYEE